MIGKDLGIQDTIGVCRDPNTYSPETNAEHRRQLDDSWSMYLSMICVFKKVIEG